MAEKKKLTKALIERTKPADKAVIIRDTEVPGMFLQVTPNGTKSLLVRFRIGKGRAAPIRQPRIPIDPAAPGAVEKARDIAREWKTAAAQGRDPVRALHEEAMLPTVAKLADEFLVRRSASGPLLAGEC